MAEDQEILDRPEIAASLDKKGMMGLIDSMPEMMEKGWASASSAELPQSRDFSGIVVAGMGGSAIGGDIAAIAMKDSLKLPLVVNRSYKCPNFVGNRTLVICASYSGNTEETIASFKEAVQRKAVIICISSGGELKKLAAANKVPFIEVPTGLPPRAAIGYLLPSLLNVIHRLVPAQKIDADVMRTVKLLGELKRSYGPAARYRDNPVKQLAVRMHGKIPVICGSVDTTSAAALRWKTQLNENSKATVLLSIFPELSHNDMVNFASLTAGKHDFSFVLLRDEADLERMKKRIEITKSLISQYVGGFTEVWATGESPLEKTMSLILFGDYLSVYLALLSGIDPTPVEIIEKLKKELQR